MASDAPVRLAVLLARGGSKRLPGKAIKPLGGVPLIGWALRSARASGCFARIVVSTDCPEIARVARDQGGETPFLRPAHLATDAAGSLEALLHAVRWLRDEEGFRPDQVGLVQPTSPFVRPEHFRAACALLDDRGFTTVETVCPVGERPEWTFRVAADGRAVPREPERLLTPSADLEPLFRETGALYLLRADHLLEREALYDLANHGAVVMAAEDAVDIDTPMDWHLAEHLRVARGLTPAGLP